MSATTFNPLATARELEAAGIERRQAEVIAEGMREAADAAAGADREALATKADLESRVDAKLAALEAGRSSARLRQVEAGRHPSPARDVSGACRVTVPAHVATLAGVVRLEPQPAVRHDPRASGQPKRRPGEPDVPLLRAPAHRPDSRSVRRNPLALAFVGWMASPPPPCSTQRTGRAPSATAPGRQTGQAASSSSATSGMSTTSSGSP